MATRPCLFQPQVALFVATAQELAPLFAPLRAEPLHDEAGVTVFRAVWQDAPLIVVQTGIGKLSAAIAATLALTRWRPKAVLSVGIAAGLSFELQVGDLVIPEQIADADDGYWSGGAFLPGGFRLRDAGGQLCRLRRLAADPLLSSLARRAAEGLSLQRADGTPATIAAGDLVGGSAFLHCSHRRAELARTFAAVAYDMESAAIAQAAAAFATPFVNVRAVSDAGDDDFARDPYLPKPSFFPNQFALASAPPQALTGSPAATHSPSGSATSPGRQAAFALAFRQAAAAALAALSAALAVLPTD